MKSVQDAMRPVIESGIPCQEGIWRATGIDQNPPPQYVIYSSTVSEKRHCDDMVLVYQTYVYMNLWSKTDPTDAKFAIRKAMYDAGFSIVSESTKGYNQPAYDHYTHQYTVQWTWCRFSEEAD